MTRYVGLDVHKSFTQVAIHDQAGKAVFRGRVATERSALEHFGENVLSPKDRIALEATFNTWAVVDILEPFVEQVVVGNPLQTKAIASAKIKTDKVDAEVLAHLLRCDYLPEVWQPDRQTRRLRSLTRRRGALVGDRTGYKNRIHAILAERLIHPPVKSLFSKVGVEWLRQLELDEDARIALDSNLRLLEAVGRELEELEKRTSQLAYEDDSVRLLMTLPAVDKATAQGLVAAWGDISRFPDADHAASYLGLVPSTRQSAKHCYHGPITKHGNTNARWLLVQAAQHLDRHPGPHGAFFRRLARRKNRNIAVVATAHKLALVAFHMLRNREPYRYATPTTTQTKLARLRVEATGKRRKRGGAKGTPRPASYGTGKRYRTVPALSTVYEQEGLPPTPELDELSHGERHALAQNRQFAEHIRKQHKIERKSASAERSP